MPSTTTEPAGGAADRATVAPFQEKTAKGQPPATSRRSPSWSSAPKISALPEMSCFLVERGGEGGREEDEEVEKKEQEV